jgi:hypothetical protein
VSVTVNEAKQQLRKRRTSWAASFPQDGGSVAPPDGEIDPVAQSVGPVSGDELVSGGNNWVLTGEGAYEGLTAWVYTSPYGGRTQGIILEGEPMK